MSDLALLGWMWFWIGVYAGMVLAYALLKK